MIGNVTLKNQVTNNAANVGSAAEHEKSNLQNQLSNKQRRLNNLEANQEMSAEEKAKERQEIQKQIAELNRKLRMEQLKQEETAEKAAKEQEKKQILKEENMERLSPKEKTDRVATEEEKEDKAVKEENTLEKGNREIPLLNMRGVLAAETTLQQSKVSNEVSVREKSTEDVLAAEIKSDNLYGIDTDAKREELSAMRRKPSFEIEVKEPQINAAIPGLVEGSKIIVKE